MPKRRRVSKAAAGRVLQGYQEDLMRIQHESVVADVVARISADRVLALSVQAFLHSGGSQAGVVDEFPRGVRTGRVK